MHFEMGVDDNTQVPCFFVHGFTVLPPMLIPGTGRRGDEITRISGLLSFNFSLLSIIQLRISIIQSSNYLIVADISSVSKALNEQYSWVSSASKCTDTSCFLAMSPMGTVYMLWIVLAPGRTPGELHMCEMLGVRLGLTNSDGLWTLVNGESGSIQARTVLNHRRQTVYVGGKTTLDDQWFQRQLINIVKLVQLGFVVHCQHIWNHIWTF